MLLDGVYRPSTRDIEMDDIGSHKIITISRFIAIDFRRGWQTNWPTGAI